MHVLTSVVLVAATLATGVGGGAVATSLLPSLSALEVEAQDRPAVVIANGGMLAEGLRGMSPDRAQPPMMPLDRSDDPSSTQLPPVCASGPWKSPLYPQNGVTLWDRIRVSSHGDRRAFLLGTAIQVHAGSAGASPFAAEATPPKRDAAPGNAFDKAA
jgi:hypothetical protein